MDIGWTLASARFLNMLISLVFSLEAALADFLTRGPPSRSPIWSLAGHVDLSFIQFSAVHELHQGGKARVLAIAADQRAILFQSKPFNTAAPSRAQAKSSSRARA